MTIALDVNILFYATDPQSPMQGRATRVLERCASNDEPICLTWGVIMGYLRLATNSKILKVPLTPAAAMENIDRLLALPQVRVLQERADFFEAYRSVTTGLVVRGNLIPDAHLATILKQHGVRTLYTADADFRRFAFLNVENPLQGEPTADA